MERKRKVVPPVYFLLCLLLMFTLHRLWPIAHIIPAPYSYLGVVLIGLGMWIIGHSVRSFSRAGTPVIPFEPSTALVTGGAYSYTRNPMYVGMVLILSGSATLFGTVGAWLPIPFFVWVIRSRFILGEERFLEDIFGEQYLAYKRRVRRWL